MVKNGCDKSRDQDSSLVTTDKNIFEEVFTACKVSSRKVKSALNLQVLRDPFLNSPELCLITLQFKSSDLAISNSSHLSETKCTLMWLQEQIGVRKTVTGYLGLFREHSKKVAKRSPVSWNSTREPRKFACSRARFWRWGWRSLF